MKKAMIFTPLIAVAMMTSVPMSSLAENPAGNNGTNTASAQVDANSKGYKDGMEAFKLDKLAGRPIGAKTSHLYKNPPVKDGFVRDQYRAQFEAGYNAAMSQGS
jgi:hypothetical protein